MEASGSRMSPYTWDQYLEKVVMRTWQGGWVQSHGELTYYSQSSSSYTGSCAKSFPVPFDFYTEMNQLQIWQGGWVQISSTIKKYYSCFNTEYDETLCEAINPCPLSIYNEMVSNGIWEGGWIQESNGTFRYMQSLQIILGSGSGSGNSGGSGCGPSPSGGCGSGFEDEALGCPVSAGNFLVGNIRDCGTTVGKLNASWSHGKTIGQNELSTVSISIESKNPLYSFDANGIYAAWEYAYEFVIRGAYSYSYGGKSYLVPIDHYFVVPEEYRI